MDSFTGKLAVLTGGGSRLEYTSATPTAGQRAT
jgi:hypothetical protein